MKSTLIPRTEYIFRTMLVYKRYTGIDEHDDCAYRDILADLMHLADEYGVDFDYELARATEHYNTERTEATA